MKDAELSKTVRILPIRQEQLQERLGERFRELDIPLLVEWPDGHQAVTLFVLEPAVGHRFEKRVKRNRVAPRPG